MPVPLPRTTAAAPAPSPTLSIPSRQLVTFGKHSCLRLIAFALEVILLVLRNLLCSSKIKAKHQTDIFAKKVHDLCNIYSTDNLAVSFSIKKKKKLQIKYHLPFICLVFIRIYGVRRMKQIVILSCDVCFRLRISKLIKQLFLNT